MLALANLVKRFGDRTAVNDVTFEVAKGQTLGLLGPNGAGKTTTLSIMSGLLQQDAGTVTFDGRLVRPGDGFFKLHVGLVPQDLALYEELTAWQNLELFAGLYNLTAAKFRERAADALTLVELSDRRDHKVKTFSGGMKRRINIAAALLHDPELLLLDEPTVGVDPQSRNAIFENLVELKRRGKTLVYTTHYMEEAEKLCDRIVIIDHGKVIANDTVHGLYRRLPPSQSVFLQIDEPVNPDVVAKLAQLPMVNSAVPVPQGLQIESTDFSASLGPVLGIMGDAGIRVAAIQAGGANLEDVFIHLTGHALRDDEPQAAS
jgi:linearmycin/streptolysin S transport system ATP-binding protein